MFEGFGDEFEDSLVWYGGIFGYGVYSSTGGDCGEEGGGGSHVAVFAVELMSLRCEGWDIIQWKERCSTCDVHTVL